jgi:ribosomal-protein-alanine N-acetyltransferase
MDEDAARLTDGIVTLRPPDEGDLAAIAEGIEDPEVVRWIGPPDGTAAQTLALNRARSAAGSPTFAICESDGICVGHVWANVPPDEPTAAAIGYWLLPAARGRGLATRAVRLLSEWLVAERGVTTLRLFTDPGNAASQGVAERGGFTRIGLEKGREELDGRSVDRVRFERRPSER